MFQNGGEDFGLCGRTEARQPDKNNSRVNQLLSEDEFAEILVLGQEHSLALVRLSQNGRVIGPRFDLGRIEDIVTFAAETVDERLVDIFVGNEIHATAPAIG